MTLPVSTLVGLDLPTGLSGDGSGSPERLRDIAREFEAMLIHQLLRQMREASRWMRNEDEDELFGDRLLETIDVEMARQLAEGGGLGLASVLMPRLLEGAEGEPVPQVASMMTSAPTYVATSATNAVATITPPGAAPDPLVSDRVTSQFGLRMDPIAGDHRFHAGVDLRAAYGREIGAAESGTVVFSGEQGGYGLTVVVEHGAGVRTRYAHLSSILVTDGDRVEARDPIGRAGHTGRATGSHLHFELIRDGERVDPTSIEGGLDGLLKKLRLSADRSISRT